MKQELTYSETLKLVNLLSRLEPGKLPPEVFEAIGRVSVYPAVEFVPLRKRGKLTEVLLIKREPGDLVWPNMYHTPGTILRPTDTSFANAFNRLMHDELTGMSYAAPEYIGAHFSHYVRGTGIGFEYWIDAKGEPIAGTFFDVNELPDDLIAEQIPIIRRAVTAYQKATK